MTVLLVDDDQDQLSVRRLLLEYHGFTPQCAYDAPSALAIARETAPTAAVVDIRLPTERHGWDLISRLKEAQPDLIILVLSGTPAPIPHPCHLIDGWITKGGGAGILIDKLNQLSAQRSI